MGRPSSTSRLARKQGTSRVRCAKPHFASPSAPTVRHPLASPLLLIAPPLRTTHPGTLPAPRMTAKARIHSRRY